MKTVLITGGFGFFGELLKKKLLDKDIEQRSNVSAHKRPAKMGIIKLLKWVS